VPARIAAMEGETRFWPAPASEHCCIVQPGTAPDDGGHHADLCRELRGCVRCHPATAANPGGGDEGTRGDFGHGKGGAGQGGGGRGGKRPARARSEEAAADRRECRRRRGGGREQIAGGWRIGWAVRAGIAGGLYREPKDLAADFPDPIA